MLIVCLDANFRLKNQLVSSEAADPGLGTGLAFFGPLESYRTWLLSCTDSEEVSSWLFCNKLSSQPAANAWNNRSAPVSVSRR